MRKLLFALWVIYLLAAAIVFAPVTLALALLAMTVSGVALLWARLFNLITFGTFR